MSDETAADVFSRHINRAIEAALAELGGGFPQGFAGILDYINKEGHRTWATVYADDQVPMVTLGILRYATLSVEHAVNRYHDRNWED